MGHAENLKTFVIRKNALSLSNSKGFQNIATMESFNKIITEITHPVPRSQNSFFFSKHITKAFTLTEENYWPLYQLCPTCFLHPPVDVKSKQLHQVSSDAIKIPNQTLHIQTFSTLAESEVRTIFSKGYKSMVFPNTSLNYPFIYYEQLEAVKF